MRLEVDLVIQEIINQVVSTHQTKKVADSVQEKTFTENMEISHSIALDKQQPISNKLRQNQKFLEDEIKEEKSFESFDEKVIE